MLLLTSSRREGIGYPDRGGTFQYFDQTAVTKPMTKWPVTVPGRDRIPELMRRAFHTSWSGRPGVVHVDIPESIMNGKDRLDPSVVRQPGSYRRTDRLAADPTQLVHVADRLRAASKPLIHVGTGVVHARAFDSLRRVAEVMGAPVTTSWGARGSLPETHPLAVPMTHLDTYQKLRSEADIVLVVGSRLGETDWWGKAPCWSREQQVIQVDIARNDRRRGRPPSRQREPRRCRRRLLARLQAASRRGGAPSRRLRTGVPLGARLLPAGLSALGERLMFTSNGRSGAHRELALPNGEEGPHAHCNRVRQSDGNNEGGS